MEKSGSRDRKLLKEKKTPKQVDKDFVGVSDHAVLRYLERVHKLDVNKIKEEMLTPKRIRMIQLGAKEIKFGHKFVMHIKNNFVITVVDEKEPR